MSNFLNVMFTISGLSFSDRIAIWRSNKNPALPVAVVTVLEGISIYFSFCKLGFTELCLRLKIKETRNSTVLYPCNRTHAHNAGEAYNFKMIWFGFSCIIIFDSAKRCGLNYSLHK